MKPLMKVRIISLLLIFCRFVFEHNSIQVRSRPLTCRPSAPPLPPLSSPLAPSQPAQPTAAQHAPSRRDPASARARAAAVADMRAPRVIPLLPPPVESATESGSHPRQTRLGIRAASPRAHGLARLGAPPYKAAATPRFRPPPPSPKP
jgi:hypothetical protein